MDTDASPNKVTHQRLRWSWKKRIGISLNMNNDYRAPQSLFHTVSLSDLQFLYYQWEQIEYSKFTLFPVSLFSHYLALELLWWWLSVELGLCGKGGMRIRCRSPSGAEWTDDSCYNAKTPSCLFYHINTLPAPVSPCSAAHENDWSNAPSRKQRS